MNTHAHNMNTHTHMHTTHTCTHMHTTHIHAHHIHTCTHMVGHIALIVWSNSTSILYISLATAVMDLVDSD